jgi:hypothetical protein
MAGNKRAGYRLATYQSSEGPRAGIVVGEDVFDAAKVTGKAAYATVAGILGDWKAADAALKKAAAAAGKSRAKRQPVAKTKFLAPVPITPPRWRAGTACPSRPIRTNSISSRGTSSRRRAPSRRPAQR